MPISQNITRYYILFTSWLFDKALPYWGTIGCDGTAENPFLYGVHEQLKLDGQPDFPGYKRMRVQARQLYTFSQAGLLGWTKGNIIAERIYVFMQNALQGEGHWAKSLTRNGKILDKASDLYDLAFIIFSLAWYGKLSNNPRPIQQARQTIQWILQFMAYPEGGFKNILPLTAGYRQQNPHMHLLEATLALFEVTQNERDLLLAHKLISLFKNHFFDHQAGVLGEYYTEGWFNAPCMARESIEPGHQYEWIWLLYEYQRLTGISYKNEIDRLFLFNRLHAIDQKTGLVADKVRRDGTLTHKSARLWVQTEALRATIHNQDETSCHHLVQILHNLLYRYFTHCPSGTWQDQLDDHYHYRNDKIPTSSFYHIMSAYIQLHKTINLSTLSTDYPTINNPINQQKVIQ